MPKMGFRADGDENVYVYLESKGGSSIIGLDAADDNRLKVDVSTITGISPDSSPMLILDPRVDSSSGAGDITFIPKTQTSGPNIGLAGDFIVQTGDLIVSELNAGVAQTDTLGTFTSTKGTDGQILISSTAGVPAWANLTAGTGISIANASNGVTISANGSTVIETITGNTGGAISPTAGNINVLTANSSAKFVGSGSTETLDFGLTNLGLGSSLSSITTGSRNAGFGLDALTAITDTTDSTAVGYRALRANASGTSNTAVGSLALLSLNNASNTVGRNTALGAGAGFGILTGEYNTLVGMSAGFNYNGAESSNILINSDGINAETNTLRIGQATGAGNRTLQKAYICGIDGVNVGSVAKVLTMASDQIGTASIAAGTNISVTPGANTITIASTGAASFSWTTVSGTSQSAAVNTGYITNNAGVVTVTLPATAAVGDMIRISGKGAGGWLLAQNAGQTVHFSGSNTTTGAGGSLASLTRYDAVELLCITANTDFTVISSVGNLTIV